MKRSLVLSFLVTALTLPGCMLFGGLDVEPVATSVQRPSNVAVYVSVRDRDRPATGLFEKNFKIYEDGKLLSADQTRQTLLPRDMAAVHRALLLLDLSGPVTEGETRQRIGEAAARFVARAHVAEPVTVYAFDGASQIRLLGEFPQGTEDVLEIPGLLSYVPSDRSSNLYGAIVEADAQLDARLMGAQKPIRIGSLVVFARGPDLAGRVTENDMRDTLRKSQHLVFAISIKDVPGFSSRRLGKDGAFEADSPVSLLHAFDEAGERVADTVSRYYLLSYCSPARAGQRHVKIEVVAPGVDGKDVTGSMSTEVDASKFTSGCDPTQSPRFIATKPVDVDDVDETKTANEGSETHRPKTKTGRTGKGKAGKTAGTASEGAGDDAIVPPPAKPGYAQ